MGGGPFGTYVQQIVFCVAAFATNWNAFVFNLLDPDYNGLPSHLSHFTDGHEISAYQHLEHRSGRGRTYAVVCYLLTQLAQVGCLVFVGAGVGP
jgi:SSS family solute:Na+ symporter